MKAIGWLIGIVLLVVLGLGVYLVLNSGSLIKSAVETLGPELLGVDVSLDAAEISLTEGTGELRGLVIGNPAGFDGPHSFSLGRIKLGLDPMAQSESLITLKTIEIDAADLALIAQGKDTNLQALMDNLSGDSGSAEGEPASTDSSADAPKIIIENFSFTNAQTSLDSDLLGERSVSIPDIRLSGIGEKSGGVTMREALKQIISPITKAATAALAKEGLDVDGLKAGAQDRVDQELQERTGTDLKGLKDRFRQ